MLITQPKILHGSHCYRPNSVLYGKANYWVQNSGDYMEREKETGWSIPLCFRPNGHKLKWIYRFVSEPNQAISHPDPGLIHKDERQVWESPGAGVDIINNYLDRNDGKHPSICLEATMATRNLCLFSLFIESLHYYSLWELGLRQKRSKVKSDSVCIYPQRCGKEKSIF